MFKKHHEPPKAGINLDTPGKVIGYSGICAGIGFLLGRAYDKVQRERAFAKAYDNLDKPNKKKKKKAKDEEDLTIFQL